MSPTRLTTNAFLAAAAAEWLVLPEADQQVRREADALPAEEQRRGSWSASTSISIAATNRLR